MKKKFAFYLAIALLVGIFGGYLITRQIQKRQLQSNGQGTLLNDHGGIEQNQNRQVNKENCLADDCLLIEDVEYPVGELPIEVQNALNEAINDEYKALSTYEAVIEKFGVSRPFSMIKGAEEQHIASLKAVYDKYGLEVPENNWPSQISAPATLQEACQIGVDAEIANAALYRDELIPAVSAYEDIILVFENLMSASEEKHLPAFEKCN
jgi:hypothetical protein